MGHVIDGFDQQHLALRQLAHGADGFGVAAMADHDDLQAVIGVALGLDMHFADQRAGGIDKDHLAPRGLGRDGFGHAVGGKDHRAVIGAIFQLFHEHRAFGAQIIHHEFVMHDLVAHIDRRAPIFFSAIFDDLDRAIHTGAKKPRGAGQIQRKGRFVHLTTPVPGTGKPSWHQRPEQGQLDLE